MKTTPIASPHQIQQSGVNHKAQADAKARAVAKLTNTHAPAQQPANHSINPNQVSPEELSAIAPQVPVPDIKPQTTEITEEKPKEDPQISARLAQLAKREKAIRLKQQQQDEILRKREAEIKAREEAAAKHSTQIDLNQYISKQRLKENPLDVLAEAELSYDELTKHALDQSQKNPRYENLLQKQANEIQELRKIIENQQKTQQEQQDSSYKAAVAQIRADVTELVKTDPQFETVKATGSVNDVVELIEKTFKEEGRLMTVEEATQEVEDYLVNEALKLTRIDKIKKRLTTPAQVKDQAATKPQDQKQTQPMKTLTNATSSTRQLSAKERAVLAFKGELKS